MTRLSLAIRSWCALWQALRTDGNISFADLVHPVIVGKGKRLFGCSENGNGLRRLKLVYAGDVDAGQRAVAPFRALAEPLVDMVRPMHYPEIFMPEEEDYHPTAAGRTLFVDAIDPDTAATIVESLRASDASMRVVQIRVLGGAVARVPVDATAYAHRRAPIMLNVAAFYEGAKDKAQREAWVAALAARLAHGDTRAYVNFLGDEGADRVRDAYPGATWNRLAEIKARYDPDNLFHVNHNIPPAFDVLHT